MLAKRKSKLKWLYSVIDAVTDFVTKSTDNHIPAYSAQASFFIVISMVPFAMLFFTVLRMFIPLDEAKTAAAIAEMLPQKMQEFGQNIVGELYSNVSFSIMSITTVVLLWSASKGVKSIVTGLQNIYGTTRPTDFIINIIVSLLYTLAFIVVMILTIIILIFGNRINELIFANFPLIKKVISELLGFRNALFLLPMTLFFAASYKLLAKNDMPFSKHFPGAFLASAGWMLFSFFYTLYIDNFAKYSYIYGSLTAIILLMLWLYSCMMIFLLAAQANVWFYEKGWSVKRGIQYISNKIHTKRRD